MRDASYAEWALGLGRIKVWKLKCFKFLSEEIIGSGTSDEAGKRTGGNGEDNKG